MPGPTISPATAPPAPAGTGPGPDLGASAATVGLDALSTERPDPAPGGRRRLTRRSSRAEAGPPAGAESGGQPGTTPSGLARRERGGEPASEPPAQHSPDDVYGFLTSFTSGVQRGLDDAHGPGRDDG